MIWFDLICFCLRLVIHWWYQTVIRSMSERLFIRSVHSLTARANMITRSRIFPLVHPGSKCRSAETLSFGICSFPSEECSSTSNTLTTESRCDRNVNVEWKLHTFKSFSLDTRLNKSKNCNLRWWRRNWDESSNELLLNITQKCQLAHLQLLLYIESHCAVCVVRHAFTATYHSRLKCIVLWIVVDVARKCRCGGHLLRVVRRQRMFGQIDTLIFGFSVAAAGPTWCCCWWRRFAAIIIKIFRWVGWWNAIAFGECLSTSCGWINREWRCLVWETWHSMHVVGMWYSTQGIMIQKNNETNNTQLNSHGTCTFNEFHIITDYSIWIWW